MKRTALAVALAIAVTAGGMTAWANHRMQSDRWVRIYVKAWPCHEDEPILTGRGDFNGVRWQRYVCIHIDRLARP